MPRYLVLVCAALFAAPAGGGCVRVHRHRAAPHRRRRGGGARGVGRRDDDPEGGGEVSGGRQTAPGETRGGRITGGTRRALTAGDVVRVSAGVPHQMLVSPGESITDLVVRVRCAGAPSS